MCRTGATRVELVLDPPRRERSSFACLLLTVLLVGCGSEPVAEQPEPLRVSHVLGDPQAAGYARATAPVPFSFPRDHGPHPEFRNEWWYWTGNLRDAAGRDFGFQFTIFRFALHPPSTLPPAPQPVSAWRSSEAWLAHFTVSDIQGRRFVFHERSARGAAGLAGAQAEPFRAWCDGWEIGGEPLRLRAAVDDVALDLTLAPGKPPVLQGDRGYSRKGADPGNASLYYSQTRMPARGTLRIGGEMHEVSGNAWMDREWSTSALEAGVSGWDWFALQLADGRDVMLYRLRREDGSTAPFSAGSIIAADGSAQPLTADELHIDTTATWRSPRGATYPAGWRLRLRDLDLTVTPRLADQELDVSVRYWEGSVAVTGSQQGVGYVELAGY